MVGTTRWRWTTVGGIASAGLLGIAALAGSASAGAAPVGAGPSSDDPGCDTFGWRHPMCAGGAWANDETASEEWGPADIPNPVTPGGDTSMTFPGSPNTP